MDPSSQTLIHSAVAYFEESSPTSSSNNTTKVVQVTWKHILPSPLGDGEWNVFWNRERYASKDFADSNGEPHTDTEPPSTEEINIALKENSPGSTSLDALPDTFFEKIFTQRTIVQTPTRILPPANITTPITPSSSAQKFAAYFLLSRSTPIPNSLTIKFTPTWPSPIAPSPLLTIPVVPAPNSFQPGDLHRSWAKSRLADLNDLQELADELARTGQRGVGTGVLKVGVDGGGHDEERIRWEAEMVGRERNWVLKKFLGQAISSQLDHAKSAGTDDLTEQKEVEEGLEMLGKLAQVLKVSDDLDIDAMHAAFEAPPPPPPKQPSQSASTDDDSDDDLFALPLSPRSPDMGVSPFSFREPAVGSLDAAILSSMAASRKMPANISTASKDAIPVGAGIPLTPTLTGSPNPGDLRKKRPGNTGMLGI